VSLYEFYLKADEVVDDNRHKQDVNDAIDDIKIDVNTLAQFKRHLQEEDSVENRNEIERYLIDGFGDPNDDKLDILG
jgi:putative ubiquitin-RnfH superfamily antitoxin RatB of RatAB toxin-antitoxin module